MAGTNLAGETLPAENAFVPVPIPPALEEIHPSSASRPFTAEITAQAAVYSIGDPSPEEQEYLELINRARLNPAAEGLILAAVTDPAITGAYSYFGVQIPVLIAAFAAIPPAQPLAFNAKLITAARAHSADMFSNQFQGHVGSDGSQLQDRLDRVDYDYGGASENVYANAENPFQGHAGFEVDWGTNAVTKRMVAGMQDPPGHRNNIHNPAHKEAGIGVVLGRNGSVGPQIVTQKLGRQRVQTPFITGVAYYDVNGNNFYDAGEGIGGLNVSVSGAASSAVTARSGGYAVPVSGNGNYTVTFSGGGFAPFSQNVTVALDQNVKVDFKPAYAAPAINGPSNPGLNSANVYTTAAISGATEYRWTVLELAQPQVEGAESGTTTVELAPSASPAPGYSIMDGSIKKSGNFAFRFAHPPVNGFVTEPIVTLKQEYRIQSNSSVAFQSRLSWLTADQIARVQVSTNEGTWITVWSQAGSGSSGEGAFSERTVNLGQFAGHYARVRFYLDFSGSSIFPFQEGVGWFVDDITFENVTIDGPKTETVADNPTFEFTPTKLGNFLLRVGAKVGHDFLPDSPELAVTSVNAPLQFEITGTGLNASGAIQVELAITAGTPPNGFRVETRDEVNGSWQEQTVTVEKIGATTYRFTYPNNSNRKFFRVRAATGIR